MSVCGKTVQRRNGLRRPPTVLMVCAVIAALTVSGAATEEALQRIDRTVAASTGYQWVSADVTLNLEHPSRDYFNKKLRAAFTSDVLKWGQAALDAKPVSPTNQVAKRRLQVSVASTAAHTTATSDGLAVSMLVFYKGTSLGPGRALLDAVDSLRQRVQQAGQYGAVSITSSQLFVYVTDSVSGARPQISPPRQSPPPPPAVRPPPTDLIKKTRYPPPRETAIPPPTPEVEAEGPEDDVWEVDETWSPVSPSPMPSPRDDKPNLVQISSPASPEPKLSPPPLSSPSPTPSPFPSFPKTSPFPSFPKPSPPPPPPKPSPPPPPPKPSPPPPSPKLSPPPPKPKPSPPPPEKFPPPPPRSSAGPVARADMCRQVATGRIISGRRLSSLASCAGDVVASPDACCQSCAGNDSCRGWFTASGTNCGRTGVGAAATLCYLLSEVVSDYAAASDIGNRYMASWI